MAVFDIETWLSSLKTEYNIPDEKIPTQEIKGGFLRQDRFSRQMQDYDTKKTELDTKFAALEPFEKFLRTLETEYQWGPREAWNAEQIAFARKNQSDTDRQPAGLDQQAVTTLVDAAVKKALDVQNAHFNQQLENTQRGAALLIDFIPDARDEWRENYGGKYGIPAKFPKPEFEQFISPGDPSNGVQPGKGFGVPLQAAWEMFTQPFKAKITEASWKEKVEKADEDGFRRGQSTGAGSLEPFADETMSAAVMADRQNALQSSLPKDQQRPEPSDAEKRSRFMNAFDSSLKGVAPVPVPVPKPVTP